MLGFGPISGAPISGNGVIPVRVSQAVIESLAASPGAVRASQVVAEALGAPPGTVRVSQAVLEALIASSWSTPFALVSQVVSEVLIASDLPATWPVPPLPWPPGCVPNPNCPPGSMPDPEYDVLAQVPAGYTITKPVWDALWCAWAQNCFQPLTVAQAIAACETVSGAQPIAATSIPTFDRGREQWSYSQIGGN